MNAIAAILLRRRQSSAVVVGEPGVGKTACALAFARAIALGDTAATHLREHETWRIAARVGETGSQMPSVKHRGRPSAFRSTSNAVSEWLTPTARYVSIAG